MKLSDKLDAIAAGSSFFGDALYAAYESETITTANDRQMLARYLYGAELTSDRFRLQELAMHFREGGR